MEHTGKLAACTNDSTQGQWPVLTLADPAWGAAASAVAAMVVGVVLR